MHETTDTRHALRMLRRARGEAERFNLDYFNADSLLLGLLRERTCVAAQALHGLGLDLRQARLDLEALVAAPEYRISQPAVDSSMPAAGAFHHALEETRKRKLACRSTPLFLLGILHEDQSAAVQVLTHHGLAPETVRAAAGAALIGAAEAEGSAPQAPPDPVRALVVGLRDPHPKVRWTSALRLGVSLALGECDVPTAEVVPLLTELLHDPDKTVRHMAADTLGHFGEAARDAVPALREALKDCEEVRTAAATALAEIGATAADAEVTFGPSLADPSVDMRVAAAAALWKATGQVERVLPLLVEGMTAADEMVAHQAADTLGAMGPIAQAAVPALIAALDRGLLVRAAAANALQQIGPAARDAVPALLQLLRSQELLDRGAATHALTALVPEAPEALLRLSEMMKDGDPTIRTAVAGLLYQLGPKAPAPALRAALADPCGLVRVYAAGALWKREQRDGVLPVLIAALAGSEEDAAVQATAVLGACGPAAAGPLRAAMQSGSPSLRAYAARALWNIEANAAEVLPVLMEAVTSGDSTAQMHAVFGLGELGDAARPAVPALLAARQSESLGLRSFIEQTLTKIDPDLCFQADEPVVAAPSLSGPAAKSTAYEEALAMWAEAIRLDPEDAHAYRCRAKLRREGKDFAAAADDADAAVRLDPEDTVAWMERGLARIGVGRFDEAVADFTEVLRRRPDDVEAYNQRGIAHKRLGDFDAAIADYSAAIQRMPEQYKLYVNRSMAAKAKGDFAQQTADLEAALRLNPESSGAHNTLAWRLATCPDAAYRDGAKAVKYARRACELSGWGTAGILNTLAAAHAEAGQFDEAVRWAKEALAHPERLTPAQIEEYTGHLRLYEQGRPFREK